MSIVGKRNVPPNRVSVRCCAGLGRLLPATAALLLLSAPLLFCAPVRADQSTNPVLGCGEGLTVHIDDGKTSSLVIDVPDRPVVVIDAVDVTGTIGLPNLVTAGQTTCTGSIALHYSAPTDLEISDCLDDNTGDFYVSANVVSEGSANCANPMPCGSVPYVREIRQRGQADAYSFYAQMGEKVTVHASSFGGTGLGMRLRVYDPAGDPAPGPAADTCRGSATLDAPRTGVYTVLVSPCGQPTGGFYKLSVEASSCPSGPELTQFAIARADGVPLRPDYYDPAGRPVFQRDAGSGFLLFLEARPGASHDDVGNAAFEPNSLPDLQLLFSRPLGDGSPAVCDNTRPNLGGIPATPGLRFDSSTAEINAINDFGCRFDDGMGQPIGVTSQDACTFFPDGDFRFVDPTSSLQFCALISQPWGFHDGPTIINARTRDVSGNVGPEREIVIQVGPIVPTTCAGDCNGDHTVTVDELITSVRVALGTADLNSCTAADLNDDGQVTIDELVEAVKAALAGCDA